MKKLAAILTALTVAVSGKAVEPKPLQPSWLSDAVVYQIYPSSFQDSNGDGFGDLKGIESRLEYVKSIGVNAIWLNPVFKTGWTDGGYDVIDFYRIDDRLGTNTDMVDLIGKAHSLGIKVLLDLVAGHSSDQNEWFKQSCESANLRYSDYYIWPTFKPESPEAESGKPMDYYALMNTNAGLIRKFVKTDAPRGPYYIKNFYDTQPALNFGFANPDPQHPWEQAVDAPGPKAMRRELKNIMSFWMDKGVDGFRVDMASSLVKNDFDKSATIKLWKEDLSKWFHEEYPENALIAEWFDPSQAIEAGFNIDFFCHEGKYNYSTLFFYNRRSASDAEPVVPYFDKSGKGDLKTWLDLFSYQYNAVKGKGYASLPSGNHDFNRLCTPGRERVDELKVAMTFFLTMPGVPFIYYGDEIGLKQNLNAPSTDGSGPRAGCRIPMLWDSSANAGFSTAPTDKIYIPQDPNPDRNTVEKSENDPASLLNYVRELIRLRSEVKALGSDAPWAMISDPEHPYPMVYERQGSNERCFIVLNPSDKAVDLTISAQDSAPEIIGGNYTKCVYKRKNAGDVITISPVSAAILKF